MLLRTGSQEHLLLSGGVTLAVLPVAGRLYFFAAIAFPAWFYQSRLFEISEYLLIYRISGASVRFVSVQPTGEESWRTRNCLRPDTGKDGVAVAGAAAIAGGTAATGVGGGGARAPR
ncbi:hypothetical protein [Nonomuraea sp. PA05]|uniref:hypothetical protein n=1 Tax=Nonomuraea sp. PA05 TaxID=2604466 RepID=UPI0016521F9E|nr:hypothetical protein [Nonomuraea sp. PA05]